MDRARASQVLASQEHLQEMASLEGPSPKVP